MWEDVTGTQWTLAEQLHLQASDTLTPGCSLNFYTLRDAWTNWMLKCAVWQQEPAQRGPYSALVCFHRSSHLHESRQQLRLMGGGVHPSHTNTNLSPWGEHKDVQMFWGGRQRAAADSRAMTLTRSQFLKPEIRFEHFSEQTGCQKLNSYGDSEGFLMLLNKLSPAARSRHTKSLTE